MGNFQIGSIHDFIFEKQDVDIDRAGFPFVTAGTAECRFDFENFRQHLHRIEQGTYFQSLVQVGWLVYFTPCLGFKKARSFRNGTDLPVDELFCFEQFAEAVADVAAGEQVYFTLLGHDGGKCTLCGAKYPAPVIFPAIDFDKKDRLVYFVLNFTGTTAVQPQFYEKIGENETSYHRKGRRPF